MNYLVWSRGGRGPTAALCELDPRASLDWPVIRQRTIKVETLVEPYNTMALESLIVMFSCPEDAGQPHD